MVSTPVEKTTTDYIIEILARFAKKWGWTEKPAIAFGLGFTALLRNKQEMVVYASDDHIIAWINTEGSFVPFVHTGTAVPAPALSSVTWSYTIGTGTAGITTTTGTTIGLSTGWASNVITTNGSGSYTITGGHSTTVTTGSMTSGSITSASMWAYNNLADFNCYIGDPKFLRKFRNFAKVIIPTPEPQRGSNANNDAGWTGGIDPADWTLTHQPQLLDMTDCNPQYQSSFGCLGPIQTQWQIPHPLGLSLGHQTDPELPSHQSHALTYH